MRIYHIPCKSCGYETKLPLGSSDLDQILTDTNFDYAEYHLFIWKKGQSLCMRIFMIRSLMINVPVMVAR
jgi:hypothetical protein